jgi:hypothetical protein
MGPNDWHKRVLSAEGAQYDSQGQALSEAKRVAPGKQKIRRRALKVRNNRRRISPFQGWTHLSL